MSALSGYDKAMATGRKLLDKHGLKDWKFDIVNLENTAMYGPNCIGTMGCCDPEGRHDLMDHCPGIYIDCELRDVRQTILHEIAHALRGDTQGQDVHDLKWINIAGEIGCTFFHLHPYYVRCERERERAVTCK